MGLDYTLSVELSRKGRDWKYKISLPNKMHMDRYGKDAYEALFDAAPDAVIIADIHGKIKMASSKVEQLFGYRKEELIGQDISFLVPDQFMKTLTGRLSESRIALDVAEMGTIQDLVARRKDGTEFPAEVSLRPMLIDGQHLITAAVRDVSQKKKMISELMNSLQALEGKNKELEQFAYIASHDLQEPLHTINSFVQLLEEEYGESLDKEAVKYLHFIAKAARRMSALISDLLDYSRLGQKAEMSEVDSEEVLQNTLQNIDSLIQSSGAVIEAGPLPHLWANETMLTLLFQNLISNAIKFRKKDVTPKIRIGAEEQKHFWQFSFEDNGIGIEEEQAEKIFIIFQRLHSRAEYEGTGIGLAQCRKIVELHGGRIWVKSKPGRGSTFYFTIRKRD